MAGALLDLFAFWGQGVVFGIGAAIGICCVVWGLRTFGGWFE